MILAMMVAAFISALVTMLIAGLIFQRAMITNLRLDLQEKDASPVTVNVDKVEPEGYEGSNYAYNHMREVLARIVKARNITLEFPWSPQDCYAFREDQARILSRHHPDMGRTVEFETILDGMVEQAMWNRAPKKEEPSVIPCVVCGQDSTNQTDKGWLCPPHYMVYLHNKEEEILVRGRSSIPDDAFMQMIHGESDEKGVFS